MNMPEMTEQIHRHLTANAQISKKDIIIGNFLGGVAWGFGTVIGATIVAAIIIGFLRWIGIFEGISQTVQDFNEINQQIRNPQLYR